MGTLWFDGVNLTDEYGVVVSGMGTYATPSRDIELTAISGRNGDIILDQNRFENVTITYPCYISRNFRDRFNSLKAFLMSRKGYCRLEDSYQPDCYRMAVYTAEIVPEMTALNRSGSFELVFNCKPQRYLLNGEEPIEFTAVDQDGFTAEGYVVKDWTKSQLNSQSTDIYEYMAYRASSGSMAGHTWETNIRTIYFDVPTNTSASVTVTAISAMSASNAGFSVSEQKGDRWETRTSGSFARNETTLNIQSRPNVQRVCVAFGISRMESCAVDGTIVFKAPGLYSEQIENPTYFDSLPLIHISNVPNQSGDLLIASINGTDLVGKNLPSDIYVDADGMLFYCYEEGNVINLSQKFNFVDAIKFTSGTNDIICKPDLSFEIIPRWWTV